MPLKKIAIAKKKRNRTGYDKEGKSLKKEWKDADGNNRRVHEKTREKIRNTQCNGFLQTDVGTYQR